MKYLQSKNAKKIASKRIRRIVTKKKENKEVQIIREIAKMRKETFSPEGYIVIDQINYYRL